MMRVFGLLLALEGARASNTFETNLLNDIVRRASRDPLARPSTNVITGTGGRGGFGGRRTESTGPVNVSLGLHILHLSLHSDSDTLKAKIWHHIEWRETARELSWDPALHGNIQHILVPPDLVWRPDLTLMLTENGEQPLNRLITAPDIRLHFDGRISWIVPLDTHVYCIFDKGPRGRLSEQQVCTLEYASWSYNGSELSLSLAGGSRALVLDPRLQGQPCWQKRGRSMRCSAANKGPKEASLPTVASLVLGTFVVYRLMAGLPLIPDILC